MPENESLFSDTRRSARWQNLKARYSQGESPDAIFPEIQDEFYRLMKTICGAWKRKGLSPKDFFDAAVKGADSLHEHLAKTNFNFYAKLLNTAIAGEPDLTKGVVVRCFLNAVWEDARGHLRLDCHDDGRTAVLTSKVDQMLEDMAHKFEKDSSHAPRRPSLRNSNPDHDILHDALPLAGGNA